MVFEVFPWKTTRTYIVRKTDAIMTLLDEQIVKTQVLIYLCPFTASKQFNNRDNETIAAFIITIPPSLRPNKSSISPPCFEET